MNANNVQIIKSDKQYERYLGIVNELMDHDPDPNSPLGELLLKLTILIEAYESRNGWDFA